MNINISDVREMLECGTATNMELTEAVEFLLRERRALGREIVRLKTAHLRRMSTCILRVWSNLPMRSRTIRNARRFGHLRCAAEDKITELKESQCSTKS